MSICYISTKRDIKLGLILKVMAQDRIDSSRPCTSGSSPSHKVSEMHRGGQAQNRDGNMNSNTNPTKRPTYITSADFSKDTIGNQGRENDLSTKVCKYAKANNKEPIRKLNTNSIIIADPHANTTKFT